MCDRSRLRPPEKPAAALLTAGIACRCPAEVKGWQGGTSAVGAVESFGPVRLPAAACGGAHRAPAHCWYRWWDPQLSGAARARHPARPRAGGALRTQQLARGCKQALAVRQAAPAGRMLPAHHAEQFRPHGPAQSWTRDRFSSPAGTPSGGRAVAHCPQEREVQSSWRHSAREAEEQQRRPATCGTGGRCQPCNPSCTSLLLCLA